MYKNRSIREHRPVCSRVMTQEPSSRMQTSKKTKLTKDEISFFLWSSYFPRFFTATVDGRTENSNQFKRTTLWPSSFSFDSVSHGLFFASFSCCCCCCFVCLCFSISRLTVESPARFWTRSSNKILAKCRLRPTSMLKLDTNKRKHKVTKRRRSCRNQVLWKSNPHHHDVLSTDKFSSAVDHFFLSPVFHANHNRRLTVWLGSRGGAVVDRWLIADLYL